MFMSPATKFPFRSVCVLRREFDLGDESNDAKLLDSVAKSLKYVKQIRPNDLIPQEILDGTASWSVEDRHRAVARDRLAAFLDI